MIRTLSSTASVLLIFFSAAWSALAQKETVIGFVTTNGSTADYRVNDVPVHCEAGTTENVIVNEAKKTSTAVCPERIFGESVTVKGRKDGSGLVTARVVEEAKPVDLTVKGIGIIDRILSPYRNGKITVRADGYPLIIADKCDWDFVDEDGKKFVLADAAPNVWIAYKGTLHPDGTVSVLTADLGHNAVTASEDRMRKSKEFKPEEVREEDRQSAVGKAFFGLNGKRVPAYKDETMQERVRVIGNKLIPDYQRQLPDGDPTKISFRFQLVDQAKMLGSLDLPSGIILIPYQVVEALPDDSQLAEILASGIADVLEKQAYRTQPTRNALKTAGLAAEAAGFFVPGVGFASIFTGSKASAIDRHIAEDCTRSSLGFMHDAGYDVRSAPVAWWLLEANRRKKSLMTTEMPYPSQYLYTVLWTAWSKTTAEASAHPTAPN